MKLALRYVRYPFTSLASVAFLNFTHIAFAISVN
jgi:hypothetical protein